MRQSDASNVAIWHDNTRLSGRSCTGGRMGNEGDMTWWKSVQARAAIDNETRPFNGMVGAIGEPNGMEETLVI